MYAELYFSHEEFRYQMFDDNEDPIDGQPAIELASQQITYLSYVNHKMRIHLTKGNHVDVILPYDTYRAVRDAHMTGELLNLNIPDVCCFQHATLLDFADGSTVVAHVYVYHRLAYRVNITRDTVSELNSEGRTIIIIPTAFGPTSLLVPLSEEQQCYVKKVISGESFMPPYMPIMWGWNYEPS